MSNYNANITVETITPTQAKLWLETMHENQRKLRESWVSVLCEEIIKGKWRLGCDCLCIINGQLANGQHRLSAVVRSNRACQFVVMRTEDKTLFSVMDCGIKRTTADVLHEYGCSNTSDMSAASKLILDYKYGNLSRTKQLGHNRTPRTEIIEFARKEAQTLKECLDIVYPLYRSSRVLPKTGAMAFLFLAFEKKQNKEIAIEFIKKIYNGTQENSSAKLLHNRLVSTKKTVGSSLSPIYIFALLIKAYKSELNGTINGTLKMVENEPYPEMP